MKRRELAAWAVTACQECGEVDCDAPDVDTCAAWAVIAERRQAWDRRLQNANVPAGTFTAKRTN